MKYEIDTDQVAKIAQIVEKVEGLYAIPIIDILRTLKPIVEAKKDLKKDAGK